MDIGHQPVSGRGTVHSVTAVHHGFVPGVDLPYLVALIELDEQPGLRLLTNVVECAPEQVHIGMPVHAVFVPFAGRDDIAAPHFQPDSAAK